MSTTLKIALLILCVSALYYLFICVICHKKHATRIVLSITPPGLNWRTLMLAIGTTYTITGVGTLADGTTPGIVDTPMTFTADLPALGTLTVVDGTHATFTPLAAGTVVLTAVATANNLPITGTLSEAIAAAVVHATQIVLTIAAA